MAKFSVPRTEVSLARPTRHCEEYLKRLRTKCILVVEDELRSELVDCIRSYRILPAVLISMLAVTLAGRGSSAMNEVSAGNTQASSSASASTSAPTTGSVVVGFPTASVSVADAVRAAAPQPTAVRFTGLEADRFSLLGGSDSAPRLRGKNPFGAEGVSPQPVQKVTHSWPRSALHDGPAHRQPLRHKIVAKVVAKSGTSWHVMSLR